MDKLLFTTTVLDSNRKVVIVIYPALKTVIYTATNGVIDDDEIYWYAVASVKLYLLRTKNDKNTVNDFQYQGFTLPFPKQTDDAFIRHYIYQAWYLDILMDDITQEDLDALRSKKLPMLEDYDTIENQYMVKYRKQVSYALEHKKLLF